MMKFLLISLLCLCCVAVTLSQSTSTAAPSTTTPTVEKECASLNASCDVCVKHAKCLWCSTKETVKCIPYPGSQIIPHKDVCDLANAKWGVCWVNYKVLLICMGVLAGVILISISCCIYCCCCRRKGSRAKWQREEAKYESERQERQAKHTERRAERQGRVDEIRRKYGLVKEDQPGYQRFDNEA